jgi:XFP N-terminal domain
MPKKEQAIVDHDSRSISTGQSLDEAGEPPKFVFDVPLSTAIAANGQGQTKAPAPKGPLTSDMLDKMNRYWRAANYLCIGQIYLFENPLLREPLKAEQIKPRLLGHWGTSPGQNLIYLHLNRLIKEHDANIIYIAGPGHGGPSLNAMSYLEGTYTEVHPEITPDVNGLRLMFRKFSTPGGVPSQRSLPQAAVHKSSAGAESQVGIWTPLVTWPTGISSSGQRGNRERKRCWLTFPCKRLTPLTAPLPRIAR